MCNISFPDPYPAFVRCVQARDATRDGGVARSRASDQSKGFSFGNIKTDGIGGKHTPAGQS
jgi:hypothetical protein